MKYKINFINNSYKRFANAHAKELKNAFWSCIKNGSLILREEVSVESPAPRPALPDPVRRFLSLFRKEL